LAAVTQPVEHGNAVRAVDDLRRRSGHFAFRVDIWDDTGDSIVEHVAGVDDFEVAVATYRAAVMRWPTARITLRQGARVIEDSRRLRVM
jgi:hypothetical protein